MRSYRKLRPNRKARLITALVITTIFLAALNWLAEPYLLWYNRLAESRRVQEQRAELEKKIQDTRNAVNRLKTPAGMEEEARRQGWNKKDEVPVIVIPERPRKTPRR